MSTLQKMRVCVCTSSPASGEPRAPKHARAIYDLGNIHLTFVDAAVEGIERQSVEAFDGLNDFQWQTCYYPTRRNGFSRWLVGKVWQKIANIRMSCSNSVSNTALSPHLRQLENMIVRTSPQVIMAHSIDTLLPAYRASRRCGAKLIFDSMEFHSDMGDGQNRTQVELIKRIERLCLPACILVTTVSQHAIDVLQGHYPIQHLLALHNVPSIEPDLNASKYQGFNLYWRNTVIGLGQRGLEDGLRALAVLPAGIKLHLQGRQANDGGQALNDLTKKLGIFDRVVIHAPYAPHLAVHEASRFHLGLCMERAGIVNHDIALSNKVFDYHMAGLAVIGSRLPAMTELIQRSGGGLTYQAGNSEDLARQIMMLYQNPTLLQTHSENARTFALEYGNTTYEMQRFRDELVKLLSSQLCNDVS